jgi:hypothetical protein
LKDVKAAIRSIQVPPAIEPKLEAVESALHQEAS